nr:hypothetical protein [uncultured Sphingomonas sp.]
MDIIAAHQQGLIERLDEECDALAGRPTDYGQRAVVLHHLYDHSVGAHGWTLLEARRQLDTAAAIAALRKKVGKFWLRRGKRDEAAAALDALSAALGEMAQRRCVAAYRAYRMTATSALEEEASADLPPPLALLLGECHARRRAGVPLTIQTCQQMFSESEAMLADDPARSSLEAAWAMIAATSMGKQARRVVRDELTEADFARAEKKGWAKLEKAVRHDPALPTAFHINPAQHFYALQNSVAEKKRKELRDAADADGDTVAIAVAAAA